MSLLQWKLNADFGEIYLVASKKGLTHVALSPQPFPFVADLNGPDLQLQILAKAADQLTAYFRGERRTFDLPLDRAGTRFQNQVWQALSEIPFGTTCSYKDIATRINNPRAVRAVGSANGKNPLCIVVPCHRVIAADGGLGGYSGGLAFKRRLLGLENPHVLSV
ncbi:MAG: methylated-DNA--[protein]-cysteine S-methyltransferase [Candidatus Margulisiibacteriota bacterium]